MYLFSLLFLSGHQLPACERSDRGLPNRLLQRVLLQDLGLQPRGGHAEVVQGRVHVRRAYGPGETKNFTPMLLTKRCGKRIFVPFVPRRRPSSRSTPPWTSTRRSSSRSSSTRRTVSIPGGRSQSAKPVRPFLPPSRRYSHSLLPPLFPPSPRAPKQPYEGNVKKSEVRPATIHDH